MPTLKRRIRILHLITGLNTGGAEMMLFKLLRVTNREQFEPFVVSVLDRGTLGGQIESLNVPVYTLKMRGFWDFTSLWKLRKLVRTIQPDLIQGWMYHGNLFASLASWFEERHIPVLWNIRQSLYDLSHFKRTTQWIIRLGAKTSHSTAKIIYNARLAATQHEAHGYDADRAIIVPNGFDVDRFRPSREARKRLRAELGLPLSTLLIGLIARYHPIKDHSNFLHAAALQIKKNPEVHFVLVGRQVDDQNPTLNALIQRLALRPYVHLLGERDDVPQIMAALDLATSSSYTEGFPNAIGEAMACGVPCVVTDVGESALLVGDVGRVVASKNPEALAAAWNELLILKTEERLQLGKAARDRIVENYSLEKVVQAYESLYISAFKECALNE